MYAAAGGASLAGRKARQHGRQPPSSPGAPSPPHPAPTGVRAYSCQHWESRLAAPPHASDLAECAAGRAAWQEAAALSVGAGGVGAGGAARRCSVLGDHPGARRDQKASAKWHRNNRVRDASYGSSSESDGEPEGAAGEPWGVARLLYAGLGTLAVGLVVYFVGTGDKGFKTPALRLVGPSLCVAGLACCMLRIMFCIFAKPCCRRRTNYKENRRMSGCAEGEELPLAGRGTRGPAQCSPARRLDSSCDVSSLSSGEEDERLRRYRGRPPDPAQATSSHSTVPPSSGHPSAPSSSQQTPGEAQKPAPAASPSPVASTSAQGHLPDTAQGIMPGNAQGNMLGSVPGTAQGIMPGRVPNNAQGNMLGSVPGTAQGIMSGTVLGSAQGNMPGTAQGNMLCIMPGTAQGIVPGSAAGSLPSCVQGSAGRRPPPRNVSFASGPDGELVLSPAQLQPNKQYRPDPNDIDHVIT